MSDRQKNIRNVTVFISSPGDLNEERQLVVEICDEITRDLGSLRGFRLEPVRWETHSHSGVGERSQEVVMSGIGDYDIYLGVMGYYFGSDTGKFASGTEEEFRDALERNSESAGQALQFYFSEATVSPQELDITQYQKVEAFRKEIGKLGVFYRNFADLPKLKALVRPALIKAVYGLLDKEYQGEEAPIVRADSYTDLRPYDRLRNLNRLFETDKEASVQLLTQEAAAGMQLVTNDLTTSAKYIESFTKSMNDAMRESEALLRNPKKKKYFLKKIAAVFETMERFNHWTSGQIETTENNFAHSLSSFQRACLILKEVSDEYEAEVEDPVIALRNLRASFVFANDASQATAKNMPEIPELGSRWSANRKIYSAVLQDFSDFLDRAIDTIDVVDRQISSSA